MHETSMCVLPVSITCTLSCLKLCVIIFCMRLKKEGAEQIWPGLFVENCVITSIALLALYIVDAQLAMLVIDIITVMIYVYIDDYQQMHVHMYTMQIVHLLAIYYY